MWRNRQVLLPAGMLLLALIVVGVVVWQIIAQTTHHNDATNKTPASSQSPQQNKAQENHPAPAQTPSSGTTNTAPVTNPTE